MHSKEVLRNTSRTSSHNSLNFIIYQKAVELLAKTVFKGKADQTAGDTWCKIQATIFNSFATRLQTCVFLFDNIV